MQLEGLLPWNVNLGPEFIHGAKTSLQVGMSCFHVMTVLAKVPLLRHRLVAAQADKDHAILPVLYFLTLPRTFQKGLSCRLS